MPGHGSSLCPRLPPAVLVMSNQSNSMSIACCELDWPCLRFLPGSSAARAGKRLDHPPHPPDMAHSGLLCMHLSWKHDANTENNIWYNSVRCLSDIQGHKNSCKFLKMHHSSVTHYFQWLFFLCYIYVCLKSLNANSSFFFIFKFTVK